MRILFFSHYFPPEVNAPASRTFENGRRWVRAGHELTVVTGAPNCPDGKVFAGYRNRLRQVEEKEGIRVVRIWTYIAPNAGTWRRIANYISYLFSAVAFALFLPRPDVCVATSPQFFCGWAGLIYSRLRRVPFVLEIRDIWPESIAAVEAFRSRRLLAVLEWLERRLYAGAGRIVTVGEGYRQRLVEKGVPPEKVAVVMNGVDRELYHPRPPDESLRTRLGLDGKFVCSYVGTIGMACGLDTALQAARRLKAKGRDDIVFLLVGDGAVRADLEAEARREGLDNVCFTGRMDKAVMPAVYSISGACLVHLRRTELFTTVMPSKIFEACGMGRPVINGVAGFAARFVAEAGAGINIPPDDADALVDAVIRLADDPELSRRYGEAGMAYVHDRYDRDRLADDYLILLQRSEKG